MPWPLAPARAMRSRTCANLSSPVHRHMKSKKKKEFAEREKAYIGMSLALQCYAGLVAYR